MFHIYYLFSLQDKTYLPIPPIVPYYYSCRCSVWRYYSKNMSKLTHTFPMKSIDPGFDWLPVLLMAANSLLLPLSGKAMGPKNAGWSWMLSSWVYLVSYPSVVLNDTMNLISLSSDIWVPPIDYPPTPSSPQPHRRINCTYCDISIFQKPVWWRRHRHPTVWMMRVWKGGGGPSHARNNQGFQRSSLTPIGSRAHLGGDHSYPWWQNLWHVVMLNSWGTREKSKSNNEWPGETIIKSVTLPHTPNYLDHPGSWFMVIPFRAGPWTLNNSYEWVSLINSWASVPCSYFYTYAHLFKAKLWDF